MVCLILSAILSLPPDSQLVARLKQRDPDALGELYDRFGKIAFSVIYKIVADRGLAEDLLQESFLKIWNRIDGFDGERGALGRGCSRSRETVLLIICDRPTITIFKPAVILNDWNVQDSLSMLKRST